MLRRITENELLEILRKHEAWVEGKPGGEQADLSNVDFRGIDLTGAFLAYAILEGANFEGVLLPQAHFMSARLAGANFTNAIMCEANFTSADLSNANLTGANLTWASLGSAYLNNTELKEADLSCTEMHEAAIQNISTESKNTLNRFFSIACPDTGSFIGWKKAANNTIVKLLIPEDAKRGSAFGRKCRCDKAICLAIEDLEGTPLLTTSVASKWDKEFIYEVGKEVSVNNFDENRFNECAPGIHFFITRDEAVNYGR